MYPQTLNQNNPMTYTTGLLGHPVNHSLSPELHNAWYKQENLNIHYQLFDIEPPKLKQFFQNLPQNLLGLSVTIPHKETVIPYLDELSDAAKATGAVNTIIVNNNQQKLSGDNTDVIGFKQAITDFVPAQTISEKNYLIFGAGGSSRAVIYALTKLLNIPPAKITITNHNDDKAFFLSEKFKINFCPYANHQNQHAEIIINTTPLGLKVTDPSPIPTELISQDSYIFDLTYNKEATAKNALAQVCQQQQAHYSDGKQMLLFQAKAQHLLFTENIGRFKTG
jgi:shikimate dehydrogenase